jgi:hypothetical protein
MVKHSLKNSSHTKSYRVANPRTGRVKIKLKLIIMIRKAIKKHDGIACEDIKNAGSINSTGSAESAGLRKIWVQKKCCLGQKTVFVSTSSSGT